MRAVGLHSLAAVIYAALSLAITWPLALTPGQLVPHDLGDPLLSTWILWWNAHVMPFTDRWWDGLAFFPAHDTLTLSDHRIGLGIIAAPLMWLGASPLAAHNVTFILTFFLCAVAAYALALALTGSWAAAFIAGLIFGFNPFRAEHLPHLELLASFWLPVSLLALHRWTTTLRGAWLAIAAVALTMQALTCGYYFFYFGVLLGLWLIWFVPRDLSLKQYSALAAALVSPLVIISPILVRYQQAHAAMGLARGIDQIETFSADLIGLLVAPELLAVWNAPEEWRAPEGSIFPGATAVVLVAAVLLARRARTDDGGAKRSGRLRHVLLAMALLAAGAATLPLIAGRGEYSVFGLHLSISRPYKPLSIAALFGGAWLLSSPTVREAFRHRRPFTFYTLATIAMWLFALGPTARLLGHRVLYKAPYAWLMVLPGFDTEFRAPARFAMLAALTLSLAAALAFHRLLAGRSRRFRVAALTIGSAAIIVESWISPFPVLPPPHPLVMPSQVPSSAHVLELPRGVFEDAIAMYHSIDHGRRIVNGLSGYHPPHDVVLTETLKEGTGDGLGALASFGELAIFVRRDSQGHDMARLLESRTAAHPIAETEEHRVFLLRATSEERANTATFLAGGVSGDVSTEIAPHDIGRMFDGNRLTAWKTPGPQAGNEQLLIDTGESRRIAAIALGQGGYVANFPRVLTIEGSMDGEHWTELWHGEPAAETLKAAVTDPRDVRVLMQFPAIEIRYVRLRQTGLSAMPWAIAELRVVALQ